MNLCFIFVAVKNSLIAIKVKKTFIFLFSTFIVLKSNIYCLFWFKNVIHARFRRFENREKLKEEHKHDL